MEYLYNQPVLLKNKDNEIFNLQLYTLRKTARISIYRSPTNICPEYKFCTSFHAEIENKKKIICNIAKDWKEFFTVFKKSIKKIENIQQIYSEHLEKKITLNRTSHLWDIDNLSFWNCENITLFEFFFLQLFRFVRNSYSIPF